MKDQRKTEIKVGGTVLVGILIFLWILGWAKNWSVSADRKMITIEFSSVSGLETGDPVTVNGVRKGYVEDITIKGNGVFTLINIPSEIEMKDDAKFYVMMLDLMGGKKIEINPGTSKNDLDISKTHKGEFLGDVASSMALLGSVQNDLVDVIKEVKTSLNSLNKTLTDEKFTNELKSSVTNLAQLTLNLNQLIKNNSEQINLLLKSGNELTKSVNDFISANKDSLSQTISAIHNVLNVSKELLNKVNDFVDQTNMGQNNLGKFLHDSDLMTDLKETIKQTKELTKILVDQLKSKGVEVNAHIF
jgi:phospholipid/cholesterol/gamma-HCH transport system substrate-binding protein